MRRLPFVLALAASLGPEPAEAGSLIPGPGEPDHDPALADKADGFVVQLHELLTEPIGFGLNARVSNPDHRALIDEFFESGARDFREFAGLHPYEIIDEYNDYTHAAIFGGVQIAGDAFRYAVLRDGGAPPEQVEEARAIFIRNLDVLDWMVRVTGTPGVVARGIRRIVPEPGEPPFPGEIPETTPLFDDSGAPLPRYKKPTWREDQSGELPFLIWVDDASRDTLDGYVFALGAAYDVGKDDPTIPSQKIDRLAEQARAVGLLLIEPIEVAEDTEIDLVIRDADGRPTKYHALSAEEFVEGLVSVEPSNGFNAVMSLGMLRTLYHVSGEPKIWARYHELITKRRYLEVMERSLAELVYFGEITNYSVVNMAFIAAYGLLRYEPDPELALRVRRIVEAQLYDVGVDRDARGLGMSFFDLIFAAFREDGIEGIGAEAVADALRMLEAHAAAPYWDDRVQNCDLAEIEALDCELLDGTRIRISPRRGYGGERVVAVEPVPVAVRPPADYMWRSDPHEVNGGGKDRMNYGGDFHAAYWLGRYIQASSSGLDNVSPIARGEPDVIEGEGCACTGGGSSSTSRLGFSPFAALLLLLVAGRRSRRNR